MTRLDGWSLSQDDWKRLARHLENVEWKTTKLNDLFATAVPRVAGIYLLITDSHHLTDRYRLPSGVSSVIYVGKSTSLRKRFRQHASGSPKNPLIKTARWTFGDLQYVFTMAPSMSESEQQRWLRDVESALVKVFSPPANRNVPTGSPLAARLAPPQPVG